MRLRGDVEIGLLVDDARALAAELERDGRQVLGGGFHDDAADRAVAGVEDVIEPLGQELGRFGDAPLDHLDAFAVDIFGQPRRNQLGWSPARPRWA